MCSKLTDQRRIIASSYIYRLSEFLSILHMNYSLESKLILTVGNAQLSFGFRSHKNSSFIDLYSPAYPLRWVSRG